LLAKTELASGVRFEPSAKLQSITTMAETLRRTKLFQRSSDLWGFCHYLCDGPYVVVLKRRGYLLGRIESQKRAPRGTATDEASSPRHLVHMSSLYQLRKFERARGCVERHRVGGVVEAALLKEARSLPHKESQYRSKTRGLNSYQPPRIALAATCSGLDRAENIVTRLHDMDN
jgi:hypothetical protein